MATRNLQTLELYSVVANLRDLPEKGLGGGNVGTIVEVFSSEDVLVEFSDCAGGAYAIETLRKADLMRLHHRSLEGIVASAA